MAPFLAVLLLLTPLRAETPALTISKGDLPLIIVAGHGGKMPLPGAEVREKTKVADPNFVLFGDAATNELATDLAGAVAQEYGDGHRPTLILNQIYRRYADVNRKPELSTHDPVGLAHHAAYHQAIDDEIARLTGQHGWVLLLDIHGQAHYDTTLLLGTGENSVIDPWSIDILWGNGGLIDSLKQNGFTVEPGNPQGKQRYGGGYTVRHHGLQPGVEAWQMEHSRAIRDGMEQRTLYLETVARTLVKALHNTPK